MDSAKFNSPLFREYWKNGYVLFRGVLSPEEIRAARVECDRHHGDGNRYTSTREFLQMPSLAKIPFLEKSVTAARDLFGDFTYFQYYMSQSDTYGGWHMDSQSQGIDSEYLFEKDYLVAKCALYLQDNEVETWGGGMDIIPGSHRATIFGHSFPISRRHRMGRMSRIQRELRDWRNKHLLKPVSLELKAGDLMIFHSCLLHKGTRPNPKFATVSGTRAQGIPRDKTKYLINWEVSPRNQYVPIYLAHGKVLADAGSRDFQHAVEARFPEDYSPEVQQLIARQGLHISEYRHADPNVKSGQEWNVGGLTVRFQHWSTSYLTQ